MNSIKLQIRFLLIGALGIFLQARTQHNTSPVVRPEILNAQLLRATTAVGSEQKILKLIKAGADIETRDTDGRTPLMRVMDFGRVDDMALLLRLGKLNLLATDNNGISIADRIKQSPLLLQVYQKYMDEIKGIIGQYADRDSAQIINKFISF